MTGIVSRMRKKLVRPLLRVTESLLNWMEQGSHEWRPVPVLNRDGDLVPTPFKVCFDCGAMKAGHGTVTITSDYIDLATLSGDPSTAEGRLWYNSTDSTARYYDGTTTQDFP